MPTTRKIRKVPTVRRMPSYLRELRKLRAEGREHVSATYLAEELNMEPIVVRKDLASSGAVGTPRIGFAVDELIDAIEEFLGWKNTTDAFLVGVGSLGTALLGYQGFREHGLQVVAAFDTDPEKIGTEVHAKPVLKLDRLPQLARRMHVNMGVLTVPAEVAQDVTDLMVRGGMRAIWNFTPVKLNVPRGVVTQSEDLASGLAVLSVKLGRALEEDDTEPED
jgi:redox-sensing transcriptional repressor